ncbi:hypothetical protein BN1058_00238 [Paraliobacillus sp. PM-2]|uniref:DUF488 domain-containing protein n=1 Tax=Paraliobacillus sp. PM-2 TaxID=1462524 RepID=UPI00061C54D5|nr:DUF488 family protein [Paraliobacillus sp. PM-2]CQR45995.1 hypothetical protein BN1058_00238 [Paraliobacillus sp. PM-2]
MAVAIKRAYQAVDQEDGKRILVDGIWPRGIAKEDLAVDLWLKEVAPSKALRKWFNHESDKFQDFKKRYKQELSENQEKKKAFEKLQQWKASYKHVTLIYGAKDETHNQAVVLKEMLK